MSSGAYPHPADEFDDAAHRVGPRGVHRAPRSRWARWRPFVLVLVVFPLLAYGLVTWLSDWDGLAGVDLPNLTADDGAAADQGSDAGTGADAGTDAAGDDGAAASPSSEPSPEQPPPPPPPVVDPARNVQVFNATSRAGLAASGVDKVEAAGFTDVHADNWAGENPDASVVYYPTPDDVATAQSVADALGITAVQESATQAPDGIVAVLASDYVR